MSAKPDLKTEIVDTDIVVIGAGACGLPAALTAAEKGAKVTVLEKQAAQTAVGAGIFAAESPVQKRQNIILSKDEAFEYSANWHRWRYNARLERDIIDRSGDTIKWMEGLGLEFEVMMPMYNYLPQTHRTMHTPIGGEVPGPQRQKVFRKRCEEAGVKFFFHCRAKKLLSNSKGEVTGVLAEMKGKELRVNAKAVILATGGYGANEELMKKYHPTYRGTMSFSGPPWLTGDGLIMGEEIGADMEDGVIMMSVSTYKDYYPDRMSMDAATQKPPLTHIGRDAQIIWVNKNGERFCREWIVDHANAVYMQPDHCYYGLFDEKFKEKFLKDKHYQALFWVQGENCPPELEDDLRSEAARGKGVKIANSWDEIAKWMGASPEVLKATMEEYNADCDKGRDSIFLKPSAFLNAMRTPPFYAVKCYQDYHTAEGCLKINRNMEVLKNDKPIPGLYSGGDVTSSWSSRSGYLIGLSGHALAFAINSGRIAAENAVKFITKKKQ